MQRSWKELGQKFMMFVVTSSIGTLVDLGLHWLLASTVFKGNYWGSYVIAPTISFEAAAIANFCIAYFFVWKERITHRGVRSFFRHLGAYNAATVGAYLLKLLAMQGLHFLFVSLNWMQDSTLEPVLCNLLGLCFSGGFNFFMSEFVIFNKTKRPEKEKEELQHS